MALFEGKSQTERNKIIAAGVLGLVALIAMYLAFGRSFFSGSATTVTVKTSPTPKPASSPGASDKFKLPTPDEEAFSMITPVVYHQGPEGPGPGRNIFAFYEPPPPTPYITPSPTPVIVKPIAPPPTPDIYIQAASPLNVYAGSRGFRLEVVGERFVPEARLYFNQTEMPTIFVNAQKLVADIPANLIAQEGPRQVIVQTPDGKLHSNQFMFSVQAPPRPGLQYIGMIGRKRYNNDTAYFLETGKTAPFGARLNDVLGGRFRLIDISTVEVVFEDVNLGFRHRLEISKAAATGGTGAPAQPTRGQPGLGPMDPNNQNIPGIPNNIPRYVPPPTQLQQPQQMDKKQVEKKEDVDDDGDGE